MAANKPAGPRPVFITGFFAGLGLVLWQTYAPSLHMLWAVPLGGLLIFSTVGKMFAR